MDRQTDGLTGCNSIISTMHSASRGKK